MIEKLQKALKEDPELFEGYKANIAIEFQDEVARFRKKYPATKYLNRDAIHEISNNAAENFLKRFSS